MLLSSQNNTDVSLQTILDASNKSDAKQEITNAVSQAFAESDGISIDAIEEGINAKIDDLRGEHWDAERGMPIRKTGGGRYLRRVGKVLEAYYAFEDAKAVLEKISRLERDADDAANTYVDQDALQAKRDLLKEALEKKTTTATNLNSYKDAHPEACQETVEKAERIFEETKSLLSHWLHIAEEFKAQKENIHDNPMQDIADRFAHYLSIISGGRVSSEFPEADKLNMNIYSENSLLDYGKLSEGTKETISLAFRLAVLDHLFPDGGGVIVFDDPFTDMDADRTAQSCELIKECAKKHQVIFLTCREDYLDMLSGNTIRF